ncbi:MAG: GWxTD domain-containing protein [Candidatus Aminicenantes bacterium]
MKEKIFLTAFLVFIFSMMANSLEQKVTLSEEYEQWLNEVTYIITKSEKEVFLQLETNKEKDLFIREFWRQRDPTPGTPRNEFKEEHYQRFQFANETFGRLSTLKGWQTDRGRMYIILGSPYQVEKIHTIQTYPIEIWYYHGDPNLGQPTVFRLLFFRRYGAGDYELYSPLSDGPKELVHFVLDDPENKTMLSREFLMGVSHDRFESTVDPLDYQAYRILKEKVSYELAEAAFSNLPGQDGPQNRMQSEIIVQKIETIPQNKIDNQYAYDFLEHKAEVEVSYSVHFMGNHNLVNVTQDPAGLFFVNYTIVPDSLSVDTFQDKYFTNIKLSMLVKDAQDRTIFQRERNVPIELREKELKTIGKRPFHLCDSFPLIPGEYKFNLLLENTVTREFTSFEKDITVPDPETLNITLPIFSRLVHKGLPEGESIRAYQIGDVLIYPSMDNIFHKEDSFHVFFQIFGMNAQQKEKGMLHFAFFKEEEEKPFQTEQKKVSENANPPNFLQEFSLKDFSEGKYLMKVSLLNEQEDEILQAKRRFSVTSQNHPGSWYVAQINPPLEDPSYHFVRGNQWLNKREMEKALDELRKAHEGRTDSLEYALSYSRALMIAENFKQVIHILTPYAAGGKEKFELFYYLGESAKRIGEPEAAVIYFQKALNQKGNVLEILNSLGSCYAEMGNVEEALHAWEKSLEINPRQDKIKVLVREIKKKRSY